MELYEGLIGRRTVYKYQDRDVDDDAIDRALDAARWAPNHKLTEPWRFTVLGPTTRTRLGDVAARLGAKKAEGLPDEDRTRQVARARSKIADVPALIVVSYRRSPDDAFRDREDYAATCCAIQNLQLALWAQQLGCQWSSGGITRDNETYEVLDIAADLEEIIGFIKVGHPLKVPTMSRRPLDEVARKLP
jgi:nitroreductase